MSHTAQRTRLRSATMYCGSLVLGFGISVIVGIPIMRILRGTTLGPGKSFVMLETEVIERVVSEPRSDVRTLGDVPARR
jgi:hypothetical protein